MFLEERVFGYFALCKLSLRVLIHPLYIPKAFISSSRWHGGASSVIEAYILYLHYWQRALGVKKPHNPGPIKRLYVYCHLCSTPYIMAILSDRLLICGVFPAVYSIRKYFNYNFRLRRLNLNLLIRLVHGFAQCIVAFQVDLSLILFGNRDCWPYMLRSTLSHVLVASHQLTKTLQWLAN